MIKFNERHTVIGGKKEELTLLIEKYNEKYCCCWRRYQSLVMLGCDEAEVVMEVRGQGV